MKKVYRSPKVRIVELDLKEMVLTTSPGLPGMSESPSDTEVGTQSNMNIWDDIW